MHRISVRRSPASLGTLAAQAVGAGNPKLAGAWVQVSLAVQVCILPVVIAAWACTSPGLEALGVRKEAAGMAGYYAAALAAALPFRTAVQHLGAFLSAQRIVKPAAAASAVAGTVNVALGLPLVLGVPIPGFAGFGFAACPWVTVGVELGQGLGLWAYAVPAKRLHERCWPGWSLSHVTLSRVRVCAEPALRAAQRNGRSRGVRNSQKPTYTHADPDARVPTHLRPRRALHRERFLEDVSSRRPRR